MYRSYLHAKQPRPRQTARKSAPPTGNSTFNFQEYFGGRKPCSEIWQPFSRPVKRARISSTWASSASEDTNSEVVVELEAYIKELHTFIDEQGLSSKAPLSIRARREKQTEKQKKRNDVGAAALAKSIHESLRETRPGGSSGGMNPIDISEAVEPLLQDIYNLSMLRATDSIVLAFDLVVELVELSYRDIEARGADYGGMSRLVDGPADHLLESLFQVRRLTDRDWDWTDELDKIEALRERLEDHGVDYFLPLTIHSMERYDCPTPEKRAQRLAGF